MHKRTAVAGVTGSQPDESECQRLHSMGEALLEVVQADAGTCCRIGTPVEAHRDLLAAAGRRHLRDAAGVSAWTGALRRALAAREGAILPLVVQPVAPARYVVERHLCIDTTAAGGNASLLAGAE